MLSIATSVPGPDRDPDLRFRERGRVVDPITSHGDDMPLLAHLAHALARSCLRCGSTPASTFINPKFLCDRSCRALVVAGEHDKTQTQDEWQP